MRFSKFQISNLKFEISVFSDNYCNMTYQRFEDLPVWNEAIRLAERVYALSAAKRFDGYYSLKDQLERAAVSVSCNIAEGFERGTTAELLNFIYIARGSAGEVRSILLLSERMAAFQNLKSEISDLKSIAESCSRQLRAWADSLQNSKIKGAKLLNDRTRREFEQESRALNMKKRLFDMLPEWHPLRVEARKRQESD